MRVHRPLAPTAIQQFMDVRGHIGKLVAHVEDVYGMFHDAIQGWGKLKDLYEDCVAQEMARGLPRERALQSQLIHGKGNPDVDGEALHMSTLGERIEACSTAGANEFTLSNLCLVSIYSHWEDRTRGDIAKTLEIDKNNVQSDMFGDIAKMRNAVLHAGGVMDGRARSLKVLKWYQPGDKVLVTRDRLHEVIEHIRNLPDDLRTPGYQPEQM